MYERGDIQPIREFGIKEDPKTADFNVTGTAKRATAGLANPRVLIVYPPDAGTVYWGGTDVTAINGAPLKSTDSALYFVLEPTSGIFLINDGTNRSVRVVELK